VIGYHKMIFSQKHACGWASRIENDANNNRASKFIKIIYPLIQRQKVTL
jgi:hypothetical protein